MMRFAGTWKALGKRLSFVRSTPPCPPLFRGGAIGVALVAALALAAAAQDGRQPADDAPLTERRLEPAGFVSDAGSDAAQQRERERAEDMEVMGKLVGGAMQRLYASAAGCMQCHSADGVKRWLGADLRRLWYGVQFGRGEYAGAGSPSPWETVVQRSQLPDGRFKAVRFLVPGRHETDTPFDPLGTYLEGYGVVYQLEAPAPVADAETQERAEAECPFLTHTPWQRAQLELRGQWKSEQCRSCHRASQNEKPTAKRNAIDAWVYRQWAESFVHESQSQWWHGGLMTRTSGPPSKEQLVKTLLDVLAENGHNFRHLAPEERVTVAVTLRTGAQRPFELLKSWKEIYESPEKHQDNEAKPEDSGAGGAEATPNESDARSGDLFQQTPGRETRSGGFDNAGNVDLLFSGRAGSGLFRNLGDGRFERAQGAGEGAAGPNSSDGVSAFDYDSDGLLDLYVTQGQPTTQELTGDLYMRQRNYAAAVESYEKAIQEGVRSAPEGGQAAQRPLYNKLIQALVAANRFDKAKEWIDLLGGGRAEKPQGAKDTAEEPKPSPLSARLVVSATKAQLDAVHAGELSREEFAKQATVRWVDPNPAPSKAAKEDERGNATR